jgi:hypothetical protein
MKPTVLKALEEWKEAFDATQQRAVNALTLALPGLSPSKTPPYCCPVTLTVSRPNDLGKGMICIDTETRATVELEEVPNSVIAEAVDAVFGNAWLDPADGPLEDAGPGTYAYDDGDTGAEYEVVLGDNADQTGRVYIGFVPVPYAAELLDAMTTARERQQQRGTGG